MRIFGCRNSLNYDKLWTSVMKAVPKLNESKGRQMVLKKSEIGIFQCVWVATTHCCCCSAQIKCNEALMQYMQYAWSLFLRLPSHQMWWSSDVAHIILVAGDDHSTTVMWFWIATTAELAPVKSATVDDSSIPAGRHFAQMNARYKGLFTYYVSQEGGRGGGGGAENAQQKQIRGTKNVDRENNWFEFKHIC